MHNDNVVCSWWMQTWVDNFLAQICESKQQKQVIPSYWMLHVQPCEVDFFFSYSTFFLCWTTCDLDQWSPIGFAPPAGLMSDSI